LRPAAPDLRPAEARPQKFDEGTQVGEVARTYGPELTRSAPIG
jgi:hypothetical protein